MPRCIASKPDLGPAAGTVERLSAAEQERQDEEDADDDGEHDQIDDHVATHAALHC